MTVLFIVATIILFLTADWFVRRYRERHAPAAVSPGAPAHLPIAYPLRTPDGIFFTHNHTWLNLFPSGNVRLGVDDFVGNLIRHPEVILLKRDGERIEAGDPLMVLKEGDRALTVRSPIVGTIVSRNNRLPENPALMREHLFSDAWGYVIRPQHADDLKSLMLGSETRQWVQEELQRLRDFFAGATGGSALQSAALLQDGGLPAAGVLSDMDQLAWRKFENDFLHTTHTA